MARVIHTTGSKGQDKQKDQDNGKAAAESAESKHEPSIIEPVSPKPVTEKLDMECAVTSTPGTGKSAGKRPVPNSPAVENLVVKKPIAKKKTAKGNKEKVSKFFPREAVLLFQAIEYGTDRIGHGAVAKAVGINKPAARMRHIRLMRAVREFLESDYQESAPGPSDIAGPSNAHQSGDSLHDPNEEGNGSESGEDQHNQVEQ